MGTSWASVITDDALLIINDLRLNEELAENPALFFRKMSFYMKHAIPRFNRPPEMKEWLAYTAPTYDDTTYTAEADAASDITYATTKTGYDLMSAGIVTQDVYGNPLYTPFQNAEYNAETGVITIHASEEAPVEKGTLFQFDFYSDGTFTNDLTDAQRRILALCIQYGWETAFANDWLNRAPRAKDRSFDAGNVSSQVRANTERINAVRRTLDDEMTGYAQSCAYMQAVPPGGRQSLNTLL